MSTVETRSVESLIPYARNARTHSDEQVAQIAASIREFGWTTPVLIAEDGTIIAGHGRVLAARKLGMVEVPCMVTGSDWSDAKRRAYVLADNQLALNAGWNLELLRIELQELDDEGFDLDLIGFDPVFVSGMLDDDEEKGGEGGGEGEGEGQGDTEPNPDDHIPEPPAKPVSRAGDVWILGRHRVMCGDSSQKEQVDRLIDGNSIDCILTDPPYCSGGFQEAGRAAGSIGTKRVGLGDQAWEVPEIANDKLSTRGYQSLMKTVLGAVEASFLYAFTDWRMWINLYDVAESSGYGVRNMIVWNKGTPGMGVGWRTQHELVAFGARAKPSFDNHKAVGNVITCKRSGNGLHPTQKPVELIEQIVGVTDFCTTFYEPFGGSGTTLIACENKGATCFAMELSPVFVDVIVRRWEGITGQAATLEESGQTYAEAAADRLT